MRVEAVAAAGYLQQRLSTCRVQQSARIVLGGRLSCPGPPTSSTLPMAAKRFRGRLAAPTGHWNPDEPEVGRDQLSKVYAGFDSPEGPNQLQGPLSGPC